MKKYNKIILLISGVILTSCDEASEAGAGLVTFVLFLFKVAGILFLIIIALFIIGAIIKAILGE